MKCEGCQLDAPDFACDDGSNWHYGCYRAAMLAAKEPDPFPLCDYCEEMITDEIVTKHEKFDATTKTWRPAVWHTDCAPGGDSQTRPADAVAASSVPDIRPTRDGVPSATTETSEAACAVCRKPIMRGSIEVDGKRCHPSCAKRRANRSGLGRGRTKNPKASARVADRVSPADVKEPTKATRSPARRPKKVAVPKPTCAHCHQVINSVSSLCNVDTEDGQATEPWHKRCYRDVMKEAGFNDPFAPEPTLGCTLCGDTAVPRSVFREHVKACERRLYDR